MVTEMLDAVESELPGHVEETEFQVSFSVIDARRQSSNSCGLMWTWPAGPDHPDVQLGRYVELRGLGVERSPTTL